jgi:hypothetical protein
MRLLICLLCGILSTSCGHHPIAYTTGSLHEIFSRAQQENKKVFVLIANSRCGQCDYFSKRLDSEETTKKILGDDYICYKIDVLDPKERKIAQIVKCPSYPFPYFFDKDGNLEAFGFPMSKEFDISDLSKIGMDEYRFREFFGLSIPIASYKRMVSLALRSYLLSENGRQDRTSTDSAYQLSRQSLDIAVYPFNLYLAYSLAERADPGGRVKLRQFEQPALTNSDKLIYGDLLDTIAWQSNRQTITTTTVNNDFRYSFTRDSLDCGAIKKGTDYAFTFELINTGRKDLVIAMADHPCFCIELQWPQKAIRPGGRDFIKGVFHAREKGNFLKKIYIHTVSPEIPMKIVTLTGVVS